MEVATNTITQNTKFCFQFHRQLSDQDKGRERPPPPPPLMGRGGTMLSLCFRRLFGPGTARRRRLGKPSREGLQRALITLVPDSNTRK